MYVYLTLSTHATYVTTYLQQPSPPWLLALVVLRFVPQLISDLRRVLICVEQLIQHMKLGRLQLAKAHSCV